MKQILLLLKLTIVSTSVYGSNGDEVRLVNGHKEYEGRVEIYHNGEWGTVCDDGWSLYAAGVVCGQLGFGPAIAATGRANYGQGGGMIWLDEVICVGNESALEQCSHNVWGINDCSHDEDAGAICEFTPNNNSTQFSCQFNIIDVESQLSLEVVKKINDGKDFYKRLQATAVLDCKKHFPCEVSIVFSNNASPPATSDGHCNYIRIIIFAIISTFITGILGCLCKTRILDILKKIPDCVRNLFKADNEPDDCTQPHTDEVDLALHNHPSPAHSGPTQPAGVPSPPQHSTSDSTQLTSNDQQELSSATTGYNTQSANGQTEQTSFNTSIQVTEYQ